MRAALLLLGLAGLTGYMAAVALAAPLTLCNLCDRYTISRRGNDVLVRCPGKVDPVLTFKDCKNPRVTRSGSSATIHCG